MKRVLCIILALMLALGATACTAPSAEKSEQDATPTQELKPDTVLFNDPALEAKVRAAMNKPEGDITAAEAQSVTELILSNEWQSDIPEDQKVKDISALGYFVNLTKLQLTFNSVTDISVLSGLTQLQILDLGGNSVGDLSPLAELTNLTSLSLFDNGLTDLSALAGLKNMNSLFIHSNQITDISILSNMKKLDLLMASDNQIADISPLDGLPLTRLYLNNNPFTDFSPIKDIYLNLTEKDFELLSADGISDEPLVFADAQFEKALRAAMNIYDRPITQKDAFLAQVLFICNDKTPGSQFSDISPLAYFTNLSSLEFNSNLISDLSPLSGLLKLKCVKVPFNQVADITPLTGLTQLEQLDLSNNQITDLSPLAGLDNLWGLSIGENPITDFSPLKDIYPNLTAKDFELK